MATWGKGNNCSSAEQITVDKSRLLIELKGHTITYDRSKERMTGRSGTKGI